MSDRYPGARDELDEHLVAVSWMATIRGTAAFGTAMARTRDVGDLINRTEAGSNRAWRFARAVLVERGLRTPTIHGGVLDYERDRWLAVHPRMLDVILDALAWYYPPFDLGVGGDLQLMGYWVRATTLVGEGQVALLNSQDGVVRVGPGVMVEAPQISASESTRDAVVAVVRRAIIEIKEHRYAERYSMRDYRDFRVGDQIVPVR